MSSYQTGPHRFVLEISKRKVGSGDELVPSQFLPPLVPYKGLYPLNIFSHFEICAAHLLQSVCSDVEILAIGC